MAERFGGTGARGLVAILAAGFALACAATAAKASYMTTIASDPSLVGYWRLGESTGPTAADVKSPGNPGTYTNMSAGSFGQTGAIAGDSDTAVRFNGTSSYVGMGNDASLNGAWTQLTMMAWIKPSNLTNTGLIIGKWKGSGSADQFALYQIGNKLLVAVADGSDNEPGVSSDAAHLLVADQYNFVVGTWTWDGNPGHHGTLALYVNGQAAGTGTQAGFGINQSSTAPLYVGAQQVSSQWYFNGVIDEPALLSRALSASEVQNLYTLATTAAPEPASASLIALLGAGLSLARRRR